MVVDLSCVPSHLRFLKGAYEVWNQSFKYFLVVVMVTSELLYQNVYKDCLESIQHHKTTRE